MSTARTPALIIQTPGAEKIIPFAGQWQGAKKKPNAVKTDKVVVALLEYVAAYRRGELVAMSVVTVSTKGEVDSVKLFGVEASRSL